MTVRSNEGSSLAIVARNAVPAPKVQSALMNRGRHTELTAWRTTRGISTRREQLATAPSKLMERATRKRFMSGQ